MKSDPRKVDTDGDKYDDNIDPNPTKSDVTVTKLKSEYLSIDYSTASSFDGYNPTWQNHLGTDSRSQSLSYGGNQSWFKYDSGFDNSELIANQGCGLIAMADSMLYLSRKNGDYDTSWSCNVSKNNPVSYSEYRDFVISFNEDYVALDVSIDLDIYFFKWQIGSIYTNTNDGRMGIILNNYFKNNGINLKANWCSVENSIYAEGHWFEDETRKRRIKDLIKKDIPAIISVGPGGNGINCYDLDTSSSIYSYKDTDKDISNHYFTVTGIIEDKIKAANGDYDAIMYKVSTWGQKYYVSEKEIKDFISVHTSLFTNVLYIEES